jgi:hypothetical protein
LVAISLEMRSDRGGGDCSTKVAAGSSSKERHYTRALAKPSPDEPSPIETSIGFVGTREYHSRGAAGDFAQWVSWFAVRSALKGATLRI